MTTINIREFEEEFVLYFGSKPKRINAYTLASSLVSIADAVKSANSLINPGYNIEVVVETFGEGSFKVKIKTLCTEAKNIFSKETLKTITLSIIAAYIYQHTLSPNEEINVIVNTNEVVIEQGDKKIIVPREIYDCTKEVEKSDKFKKSIGRTFEALEKDKDIESFGLTPRMEDEAPLIIIPREKFALLSEPPEIEDNQRSIIEAANLHILRAILERGSRKWEFVWQGIKISAPVLDEVFYNDFFAHKIMIAPGDSIKVKLKIYQSRDEDTGIFTTNRYEVIEVIQHIPRMKQTTFEV